VAGMIFSADGLSWGTSSAIFYWVIDTLAGQVVDPGLAARLQEISEYNLGSLSVAGLSQAH
jgi:hypothetical protein